MRKISGHVVATKAITLSRAAKLISRFAAVDNGSSAGVSMYLQRTADAFNQLVQFHEKRSKIRNIDDDILDQKSVGKLHTDGVEKSFDGGKGKELENRGEKSDKKTVNNLDEAKVDGGKAKDMEITVKESKGGKKKRRKSDEADDLKEKSNRKKKRRDESAVDS